MQQPIPLHQWAPEISALWLGLTTEFRAAREVPPESRTGITWHHSAGGTTLDPEDFADDLVYAARFSRDHFSKWNRPGGYNFGITQDGRILEHTPPTHRGAHAGTVEWNTKTIGVCLYGNFQDAPPPDDQLQGARNLTAWLIDGGWIPAAGAVHKGHRDVRPSPTSCPGDVFYSMLPDAVLGSSSSIDVPSEWAAMSWDAATRLGLVNGRSPREPLTREQFAAVITRTAFRDWIRQLSRS